MTPEQQVKELKRRIKELEKQDQIYGIVINKKDELYAALKEENEKLKEKAARLVVENSLARMQFLSLLDRVTNRDK